jgi:hypothetical protein
VNGALHYVAEDVKEDEDEVGHHTVHGVPRETEEGSKVSLKDDQSDEEEDDHRRPLDGVFREDELA